MRPVCCLRLVATLTETPCGAQHERTRTDALTVARADKGVDEAVLAGPTDYPPSGIVADTDAQHGHVGVEPVAAVGAPVVEVEALI